MSKRVIIAVGGTGGHVFPAIALAKQLQENNVEVLFIGGGLSKNRYFLQKEFNFKEIACGTFSLRRPWTIPLAGLRISQGMFQTGQILRTFRPQLMAGFGSYYSLPPLLAAKLHKIPLVLHAADSIPGKVIKLLSPYAKATGVHFPGTGLKGNVVEVGMPLRPGYIKGLLSSTEARSYFNVDQKLPTLLVFGGSQGAHALNELVLKAAEQLKPFQIIHITGNAADALLCREKYAKLCILACVKEFESRMDYAWSAADFVVSRAGAGSIAEQLEYEVPGILIPFPHAMDNHQEANADKVEQQMGLAVKCNQQDLTSQKLAEVIAELFQHRFSMVKKAQSYKTANRQQDLCQLILSSF